ncbi:hypothetical protein PC129_g7692 [Phytophthora cactorum]|nr:hypothetical protein Pcac1_g9916 [Phytophthora cactorum]KAG2825368.1 hypothetical protein PC112_g9720 [Phytophthora cactorum]KAG2829471.1 hypothetical protein PC111_g7737 [Phytophthora cactorum]KAG3221577.1 hypothetical protein PC129_g7692 [Phytophthora cactorum]
MLGLIAIAIVNCNIVHKAYHQSKSTRLLTHVKFIKHLHKELCQLQEADMYEANTFGQKSAAAAVEALNTASCIHIAELLDLWRDEETQLKRSRRAC